MENKETSLPCIICGRNDCYRVAFRNNIKGWPLYAMCLECIIKRNEIERILNEQFN